MKLMIVNEKIIGEKLANPLYNENGIMFINSGREITETVLKQFKRLGISSAYIEDGNDEMELQEVLPTVVKLRNIKAIRELFIGAEKNKYIDDRLVVSIVKDLVENINRHENAVLLSNIASTNSRDSIITHTLDVAILALMVGANRKLNESNLIKLGMTAILHDIGKLFDSSEKHTQYGYQLIKQNTYFSVPVYMSVYYSNERVDGQGLKGIQGNNIHEFGKIIAICNEYSKLTTGGSAILPHEAIDIILAGASSKFDKDLVKTFVDSIYCYPTGLRVKISNGTVGIVAMQNKGMTTRPIIVVDSNNSYSFCNLVDKCNLTLSIEEVIM